MDTPLRNATAVEEVPVWQRAHQTLDEMANDMRDRLNNIDHQQARLAGEADALRGVLSRISPPPPQPVGYGAGSPAAAPQRTW